MMCRLTITWIHSAWRSAFHSTMSWPASRIFSTRDSSTRLRGGCGRTTPSSARTPMVSGLDLNSSNISLLQGTGAHRASSFQGSNWINSFITKVRDGKLRVNGPTDDGTCSWPSVDTGAPWYGRREYCETIRPKVHLAAYGGASYTWFQPVQTHHRRRYPDTTAKVGTPTKETAMKG